ncbi:MAG: hypothetical protein M1820_006836, partial [Bogoriella megaspora]
FHFLAGALSGTFTAALLQPADLLKTRVQQSSSVSLTSALRVIAAGPAPLRQLWRGTAPSVVRTGMGSALYFGGLNYLRTVAGSAQSSIQGDSGGKVGERGAARGGEDKKSSSALPKLSKMGNLVTGALARASAGFVMMPVTVIKVRFESSYYHYGSLWGAGRDIVRLEGVGGLFKGWGATAVRDAPYAGLYVVFYEEGKKRLAGLSGLASKKLGEEGGGRGLSATSSASINFVSGVLAAGAATAATNPFDAIKTRLQILPGKYGNMIQAARLMLREEGVRSLFDGLGLRIARKAISSALAWTAYEEVIRRAEQRFTRREEGLEGV